MTLGQDVAAALPELRLAAESMMVDTCRVRRLDPDMPSVPDPDTLALVPNYLSENVYVGACRVQRSGALSPQESPVGGYEFGVGTILAQLPLSATGILRDDVLEVTAVAAISDPDLVGVVASVRANLTKTHATKRTLICEQVTP